MLRSPIAGLPSQGSSAVTLGLVLAGGGARGAYEAGVLRFVFGELPRRASQPVEAKVVSGTSVGALNGSYIAARTGDPQGPLDLSAIWQTLQLEGVYRFDAVDLLRSPFRLLGTSVGERPSLVDASPLHALIHERFPWKSLRDAVDSGRLHALVVACTEVATGRSVLYVDRRRELLMPTNPHKLVEVVETHIDARHILGSSAIPFLFPPVDVDGRVMVDGSLRHNTPLSPALRLGADRVIVVGVKRPFSERLARTSTSVAPDDVSLSFVLGKALNALMLDPIEKDLRRLNLYNDLFSWGQEAYGPDFLDRLNQVVVPRRGAPFRRVRHLHLCPRRDLGQVAAAAWDRTKVHASRSLRLLLDQVASGERPDEADLLSYLLFDRSYTAELERLGYEDARDREEEIAAFLELGTQSP